MELRQNTAASLRFPEIGGDAVAFDESPKVTVTRDSDGTKIIEDKEATKESEGPYYTVELTPAQTSEVDLLTVEWTGKVGGSENTYTVEAEIVGGFVVSLQAIEDRYGEGIAEAKREATRETALREIENACGVAFRTRYAKDELDGTGTKELLLRHPRLQRVLSVEIRTSATETESLTEEELEELRLDKASSVLHRTSKWPAGQQNIVVTYAHGYTSFSEAALPVRDYAAYLLTPLRRDIDQRATSLSTEEGTYSMVTPGVRGATFPLPSVNAFVNAHRHPVVG